MIGSLRCYAQTHVIFRTWDVEGLSTQSDTTSENTSRKSLQLSQPIFKLSDVTKQTGGLLTSGIVLPRVESTPIPVHVLVIAGLDFKQIEIFAADSEQLWKGV